MEGNAIVGAGKYQTKKVDKTFKKKPCTKQFTKKKSNKSIDK